MIHNYISLCIICISVHFLAGTIAHEAIIHGELVHGRQYSYQVSVQIHGQGHVCGGGIIDDQFILTAAQCLLTRTRHLRSTNIFVVAGTNNLNRTGPPAVTVRVEKVFFPSEYHPTTEFNHGDIAVLRVVRLLYESLVNSLPLSHHSNLMKLDLPQNYDNGIMGTIAGYGWNKYNLTRHGEVGSTDGLLRCAGVDVLSHEQCAGFYSVDQIEPDIHLCANIRGPVSYSHHSIRYGVCNGDNGSPLIQNGTTIIGILSRMPHHCDERLEPAFYTRVVHYLPMIYGVMRRGNSYSTISLNV